MTPRRLDIDHVAPPRRLRWPGYLLLLAGIWGAAEVTSRYQQAQLALERYKAAQSMVNVRRPPVRSINKNRLDEQVSDAQNVVRQLTLPWARLIETVEQAGNNDISLLQLQPDAQQRLLRITAEAPSYEAIVAYLARLSAARGLSYVHLVAHQVRQDDPRRPVLFTAQTSFKAMR